MIDTNNRPVPTTVAIPEKQYEWTKDMANKYKTSMNQIITACIKIAHDNEDKIEGFVKIAKQMRYAK